MTQDHTTLFFLLVFNETVRWFNNINNFNPLKAKGSKKCQTLMIFVNFVCFPMKLKFSFDAGEVLFFGRPQMRTASEPSIIRCLITWQLWPMLNMIWMKQQSYAIQKLGLNKYYYWNTALIFPGTNIANKLFIDISVKDPQISLMLLKC